VRWNDPRIERVLDWLETHVVDRQKLFSDSSKEAAEEGRKKCVVKGSKSIYCTGIAKDVFSVDDDARLRDAVGTKLEELGKSVENMSTRFGSSIFYFESALISYKTRCSYHIQKFNAELGKTGAGLDYSEIEFDSDIYNKIDELKDKFNLPYWDCLHGFWRTLPSLNPTLVTAEPGQDLAAEALKLTHRYHENGGEGEGDDDKTYSE
ncbi:hypothetical protein B0H17DRAFT_959651, partial [Mycena rosella]